MDAQWGREQGGVGDKAKTRDRFHFESLNATLLWIFLFDVSIPLFFNKSTFFGGEGGVCVQRLSCKSHSWADLMTDISFGMCSFWVMRTCWVNHLLPIDSAINIRESPASKMLESTSKGGVAVKFEEEYWSYHKESWIWNQEHVVQLGKLGGLGEGCGFWIIA